MYIRVEVLFSKTSGLQIDNSRERERAEQLAPEIPRVEVELSEMSASAAISAAAPGPACTADVDVPCRRGSGGSRGFRGAIAPASNQKNKIPIFIKHYKKRKKNLHHVTDFITNIFCIF